MQGIPPAHLLTPGMHLPPTEISKKYKLIKSQNNCRVTAVTLSEMKHLSTGVVPMDVFNSYYAPLKIFHITTE